MEDDDMIIVLELRAVDNIPGKHTLELRILVTRNGLAKKVAVLSNLYMNKNVLSTNMYSSQQKLTTGC